jgi:signal transduction histidine kinase
LTSILQILRRIRFNIFTKIFIGYLILIGIMLLASLTILPWFKPEDLIKFRVVSLGVDIEKFYEVEQYATRQYINSGSSNDSIKLSLTQVRLDNLVDSMYRTTEDTAIKIRIQEMSVKHRTYRQLTCGISDSLIRNNSGVIKEILLRETILSDSLKSELRNINITYLPIFAREFKKYDQHIRDAIEGGSYVIIFVIFASVVLVILMINKIIKPIRVLQAGTQQIGEGNYETVPIISNDEIADLTRAFNLMSEKLKQLDEMRMQMMSEISHEMRTPLQVIKAGCYSIIHAKDSPQLTQRQRDAVGMIHQATNRINSFVNSFLDIAKMEAGLMKFNFEKINLIDLLTPLIQEAHLIAQTRQIDLIFNTVEIPQFLIDKERISQAFSNLLSNALKYTPDNGSIIVNIAKVDGANLGLTSREGVQIEVQDTGVGIPEADLGKLFNKFYQAKNVPLVNEKGSGLGLALVKHVAEAHGGRVSVKSQVGFGSLFTIILPINE